MRAHDVLMWLRWCVVRAQEACHICGGSAGSQKVMMMHGPDQVRAQAHSATCGLGWWLCGCRHTPGPCLNSQLQPVSMLQPSDAGARAMPPSPSQDKLWRAAETGELATVRATLTKLGVVPTARQGGLPAVPVRVLVRPAGAGSPGARCHSTVCL